jgi:hypothetical protein
MICKRALQAGQATIRMTGADCKGRDTEGWQLIGRILVGGSYVHSFLDPTSIVSEIIDSHKH